MRNAPGSLRACARADADARTKCRGAALQPGNETLHSAQRTLITMLRSWAGLILLAADPQVGRRAGGRAGGRQSCAGVPQQAVGSRPWLALNLRVSLRRFGSVCCVQRWAGAGTRTCTHA